MFEKLNLRWYDCQNMQYLKQCYICQSMFAVSIFFLVK